MYKRANEPTSATLHDITLFTGSEESRTVLGYLAEMFNSNDSVHAARQIAIQISKGMFGAERKESIRQRSQSFCTNVGRVDVNWLISEISSKCGSDKVPIRREAFQMLSGLL